MSEKVSEFSEMSDGAAAAALMRELAPAGSAKERIGAAARALRWRWVRAKAVWYGEARRIDAAEMDALRAAVRRRELQEDRREFTELRARIARLEAAIAVAHPTLDREALDEVQRAACGPGRMAGAGADGLTADD
jgi:hypothetical protein